MMQLLSRNYDLFNDFMFNNNSLMKTDIKEKDGYYYFDIELPGYQKENIDLEIDDGYITIKAESEIEKEEEGKMLLKERQYSSCSRSFYVGNNIKSEDISASFNDGILKLIMPSRETKHLETVQKIMIE